MIEKALHYREVLKSNLLPVGKPEFGNEKTGKLATCKWKQFQGVLQTRSDIERLFARHGGNMAMMVGRPNGFVSFDEDSPAAAEWATKNLPGTPLLFSTGRGQQRLYKAPDIDLPTKINVKGLHGDLKSSGYVIIPPSLHHTGKRYAWRDEPTKELFDQTPVWPVDAIIEERKHPEPSLLKITNDVREAIAITSGYLRKMDASISGSGGHVAAFRAACKIRDRLAPLGLGPEDCLEIFDKEFNSRCSPPWSEVECLHKLRSAWKQRQP